MGKKQKWIIHKIVGAKTFDKVFRTTLSEQWKRIFVMFHIIEHIEYIQKQNKLLREKNKQEKICFYSKRQIANHVSEKIGCRVSLTTVGRAIKLLTKIFNLKYIKNPNKHLKRNCEPNGINYFDLYFYLEWNGEIKIQTFWDWLNSEYKKDKDSRDIRISELIYSFFKKFFYFRKKYYELKKIGLNKTQLLDLEIEFLHQENNLNTSIAELNINTVDPSEYEPLIEIDI